MSEDLQSHVKQLHCKVITLQFVRKHLYNVDVKIEVTFRDGTRIELDQSLIPFNLEWETRKMLDDSIDQYQRTIKNLLARK